MDTTAQTPRDTVTSPTGSPATSGLSPIGSRRVREDASPSQPLAVFSSPSAPLPKGKAEVATPAVTMGSVARDDMRAGVVEGKDEQVAQRRMLGGAGAGDDDVEDAEDDGYVKGLLEAVMARSSASSNESSAQQQQQRQQQRRTGLTGDSLSAIGAHSWRHTDPAHQIREEPVAPPAALTGGEKNRFFSGYGDSGEGSGPSQTKETSPQALSAVVPLISGVSERSPRTSPRPQAAPNAATLEWVNAIAAHLQRESATGSSPSGDAPWCHTSAYTGILGEDNNSSLPNASDTQPPQPPPYSAAPTPAMQTFQGMGGWMTGAYQLPARLAEKQAVVQEPHRPGMSPTSVQEALAALNSQHGQHNAQNLIHVSAGEGDANRGRASHADLQLPSQSASVVTSPRQDTFTPSAGTVVPPIAHFSPSQHQQQQHCNTTVHSGLPSYADLSGMSSPLSSPPGAGLAPPYHSHAPMRAELFAAMNTAATSQRGQSGVSVSAVPPQHLRQLSSFSQSSAEAQLLASHGSATAAMAGVGTYHLPFAMSAASNTGSRSATAGTTTTTTAPSPSTVGTRHNLYFNNLPLSWNTAKLRDMCAPFGSITSAKIAHHERTNASLGHGFVLFEKEESACACKNALHGKVVPDEVTPGGTKAIQVSYAHARAAPHIEKNLAPQHPPQPPFPSTTAPLTSGSSPPPPSPPSFRSATFNAGPVHSSVDLFASTTATMGSFGGSPPVVSPLHSPPHDMGLFSAVLPQTMPVRPPSPSQPPPHRHSVSRDALGPSFVVPLAPPPPFTAATSAGAAAGPIRAASSTHANTTPPQPYGAGGAHHPRHMSIEVWSTASPNGVWLPASAVSAGAIGATLPGKGIQAPQNEAPTPSENGLQGGTAKAPVVVPALSGLQRAAATSQAALDDGRSSTAAQNTDVNATSQLSTSTGSTKTKGKGRRRGTPQEGDAVSSLENSSRKKDSGQGGTQEQALSSIQHGGTNRGEGEENPTENSTSPAGRLAAADPPARLSPVPLAEKEESKCNIYVTNLPLTWNTAKLIEICAAFGPIVSAKIPHDPDTNASRGYGFVFFERAADAAACIEELHHRFIPVEQCMLSCRYAKERATPTIAQQQAKANAAAAALAGKLDGPIHVDRVSNANVNLGSTVTSLDGTSSGLTNHNATNSLLSPTSVSLGGTLSETLLSPRLNLSQKQQHDILSAASLRLATVPPAAAVSGAMSSTTPVTAIRHAASAIGTFSLVNPSTAAAIASVNAAGQGGVPNVAAAPSAGGAPTGVAAASSEHVVLPADVYSAFSDNSRRACANFLFVDKESWLCGIALQYVEGHNKRNGSLGMAGKGRGDAASLGTTSSTERRETSSQAAGSSPRTTTASAEMAQSSPRGLESSSGEPVGPSSFSTLYATEVSDAEDTKAAKDAAVAQVVERLRQLLNLTNEKGKGGGEPDADKKDSSRQSARDEGVNLDDAQTLQHMISTCVVYGTNVPSNFQPQRYLTPRKRTNGLAKPNEPVSDAVGTETAPSITFSAPGSGESDAEGDGASDRDAHSNPSASTAGTHTSQRLPEHGEEEDGTEQTLHTTVNDSEAGLRRFLFRQSLLHMERTRVAPTAVEGLSSPLHSPRSLLSTNQTLPVAQPPSGAHHGRTASTVSQGNVPAGGAPSSLPGTVYHTCFIFATAAAAANFLANVRAAAATSGAASASVAGLSGSTSGGAARRGQRKQRDESLASTWSSSTLSTTGPSAVPPPCQPTFALAVNVLTVASTVPRAVSSGRTVGAPQPSLHTRRTGHALYQPPHLYQPPPPQRHRRVMSAGPGVESAVPASTPLGGLLTYPPRSDSAHLGFYQPHHAACDAGMGSGDGLPPTHTTTLSSPLFGVAESPISQPRPPYPGVGNAVKDGLAPNPSPRDAVNATPSGFVTPPTLPPSHHTVPSLGAEQAAGGGWGGRATPPQPFSLTPPPQYHSAVSGNVNSHPLGE